MHRKAFDFRTKIAFNFRKKILGLIDWSEAAVYTFSSSGKVFVRLYVINPRNAITFDPVHLHSLIIIRKNLVVLETSSFRKKTNKFPLDKVPSLRFRPLAFTSLITYWKNSSALSDPKVFETGWGQVSGKLARWLMSLPTTKKNRWLPRNGFFHPWSLTGYDTDILLL